MSIVINSFGFVPNAIPSHICDRIIKTGLSQKNNPGTTGKISDFNKIKNNPQLFKELIEKRDSNVGWLNDPWIYKSILPFVEKANEELQWDFQYEEAESAQFTTYYPGQFYSWHQDSLRSPPKTRKISLTLSLNDPSEYEGGQLQFDCRNKENPEDNKIETIVENQQGSLVIFPSFTFHRVLPVTKGVRYSLVMWMKGDRWR
tara:strand:+ start:213 stop:818 length:606 start_codon:yes stop_codon:yes gene_type:complete